MLTPIRAEAKVDSYYMAGYEVSDVTPGNGALKVLEMDAAADIANGYMTIRFKLLLNGTAKDLAKVACWSSFCTAAHTHSAVQHHIYTAVQHHCHAGPRSCCCANSIAPLACLTITVCVGCSAEASGVPVGSWADGVERHTGVSHAGNISIWGRSPDTDLQRLR